MYGALPKEMRQPGWEQGSATILKPVCQRCQRRLNDKFENPAKRVLEPMLQGFAMMLTPRQQVVAAAWFVKTGLVLSLCPGRVEAVSAETAESYRVDLREMLDRGTPSEHATTRLACIAYHPTQSAHPFLPDGWPDDRRYWTSNIITLPYVASETITAPEPSRLSFIDATQDDHRFIRIWPPLVTSQSWPPAVQLGIGDPQALRKAWGHPEMPHGNFAPMILPPSQPGK
jgi:hypothetical protein